MTEEIKRAEEVLKDVMEYFDQRADCSTDNPAVPNEEMRLWEDLNNSLKYIRKALRLEKSGLVPLVERRVQLGSCSCATTIKQNCDWHMFKKALTAFQEAKDA